MPSQRLDYIVGDRDAGQLVQFGQSQPVSITTTAGGQRLSFRRPNDTTAYTAQDVVGPEAGTALLRFTGLAPQTGGEIMITSAHMQIGLSSVTSGMGNFLLYLYSSPPSTSLSDNGAFSIALADMPAYLGKIRLSTPIDEGAVLAIDLDGINKQRHLASDKLYVYIVTEGAYTPAALTQMALELHTVPV